MFKILFQPDNILVEAESGSTLLQSANSAGFSLKATCGGKGTCGKCLLTVLKGEYFLKDDTILRKTGKVPACQTFILSDMEVAIPEESRLVKHQVLLEKNSILKEKEIELSLEYKDDEPLIRRMFVKLPEPSLTENSPDLTRLMVGINKQIACEGSVEISLPVLRKLPHVLREGGWNVTIDIAHIESSVEVIDIACGNTDEPHCGLAIDIGTTTVVVYLVDLKDGQIIDKRGTYNKQARYGDDVISRMVYADDVADGLKDLQNAVVVTINELISELYTNNPMVKKENVKVAVCAGNTTMTQLFLGIDPKFIRLEPYIPTAAQFPIVKAKDLDLLMHNEGLVANTPCISSYVGGDIVAGALAVGIDKSEELTLFIDIGTNGEMVLGNKDWLVSCACSAGPAFEGGGITFGMRAMIGAIERVEISPSYEVEYSVIGGAKPSGICGSGLIDCLSKLHQAKLIDRTGKFQMDVDTARLRRGIDGPEFVLAWAMESAQQKDVVITESDVKNLLRAKGAIFAGIRTMLEMVSLSVDSIDKILIAGGFGNFLDLEDSIRIGLLPDLDRKKYQFVGNTSVKGAYAQLMSTQAYMDSHQLAKKLTYLELSAGNTFMEEFVSATFLPHTDLGLFPSVKY